MPLAPSPPAEEGGEGESACSVLAASPAKDHMRARGVKSPDEWDAVALTFAEPVAPDAGFGRRIEYPAWGVA